MSAFDEWLALYDPIIDFKFDEIGLPIVSTGNIADDINVARWSLGVAGVAPDLDQAGGACGGSEAAYFNVGKPPNTTADEAVGQYVGGDATPTYTELAGKTSGSMVFALRIEEHQAVAPGISGTALPLSWAGNLISGSGFEIEHFYTRNIGFGAESQEFTLYAGVSAVDYWRWTPNASIADNNWHLITIVHDGVAPRMWVDQTEMINAVNATFVVAGTGSATHWFNQINNRVNRLSFGGAVNAGLGSSSQCICDWDRAYATDTVWTDAQVEEIYQGWANCIGPILPPPGGWVDTISDTGNEGDPVGPGPDWWWRMNASMGVIQDIGIAQNRAGPIPPPINADAIVEGGNPIHGVAGPLPLDLTSAAIYFDGLGDYYEIGVNGVPGQLVDVGTGTIGFFFSRNSADDSNIVYSQGNDAYTSFWQLGLNGKRIELIVQTSAGNRVTYTGSADLNGDFFLVVLTCDGAKYRLYVNSIEDTDAVLMTLGTGAEGDWFDALSADQSAVAAMADNPFTTETTGRAAEIFIYDGDVLNGTEIGTLWEAAIADGVTGVPNPVGVLVFENVTFKNGAFADIRAEESTGTFQQVIKANRSHFIGGAQGSASYQPQMVLLKGPAQAQFRGCDADLQAVPTFGRGGIVGSAINTALQAVQDGSILVSDCDFDGIGYLNGSNFLAPVMCQAAFGMTVEESRFRACLGTAVGWLADAQRVVVVNNQIEGTTQALAAIYAAQGLNARLGSGWMIRGNKAIDTDGNAIDLNGVSSAGGLAFARNVSILKNETDNNTAGVGIRANQLGDLIIAGNKSNRCTEGVRLGALTGAVLARRNEVTENSATAIIAAEGSLQLMDLTLDRNKINGGVALGDGITVTNVRRLNMIENKLRTLDLGIQLGEIAIEANLAGNQVASDVATPFALLGGTTQVGLRIGNQFIPSLGNANVLTVAADTIAVTAHHHAITIGVAGDLATVDGPLVDGWLLILRRAPFSQTITVRDGVDNLNLAGDFAMSTDDSQIWLVRDGANWNEVSRFLA